MTGCTDWCKHCPGDEICKVEQYCIVNRKAPIPIEGSWLDLTESIHYSLDDYRECYNDPADMYSGMVTP